MGEGIKIGPFVDSPLTMHSAMFMFCSGMDDDDDTPSRAPLAVGWDDEDVAMLREMAQLTMDQSGDV